MYRSLPTAYGGVPQTTGFQRGRQTQELAEAWFTSGDSDGIVMDSDGSERKNAVMKHVHPMSKPAKGDSSPQITDTSALLLSMITVIGSILNLMMRWKNLTPITSSES